MNICACVCRGKKQAECAAGVARACGWRSAITASHLKCICALFQIEQRFHPELQALFRNISADSRVSHLLSFSRKLAVWGKKWICDATSAERQGAQRAMPSTRLHSAGGPIPGSAESTCFGTLRAAEGSCVLLWPTWREIRGWCVSDGAISQTIC